MSKRRHNTTTVILVGLMLTACTADSGAMTSPKDAHAVQWTVTTVPEDSVHDSPLLLEIARQLPTFAGMYFANGEDLIVLLTDLGDLARAEAIIPPMLGAHQPRSVKAERATYTFMELAKIRTVLGREHWGPNGIMSLDLDERSNRVTVGLNVGATSVGAHLAGRLPQLRIPPEAVTFVGVRAPVAKGGALSFGSASMPTLNTLPSAIVGGYEIGYHTGACTIGFPAIRAGVEGFVTNSHCSTQQFQNDGGEYWTSNYAQIGFEIWDPAGWSCMSILPPGVYPCRNADANFVQATMPIQLGAIARTTGLQSTVVHASSPTWQITSTYPYVVVGEGLHKVGKTTGWTFGMVIGTCEDKWMWPGWVKKCSDTVVLGSEGGDSGSPVFFVKPDGTIELRGVMFGGFLWGDNTYMSNLSQIQKDLGVLHAYDPGPPSVVIQGPDTVEGGAVCAWVAVPVGGLGNFTFAWSGVLQGNGSHVEGIVQESGDLQVIITETYLGRQAAYSKHITVQGTSQTEHCPEY